MAHVGTRIAGVATGSGVSEASLHRGRSVRFFVAGTPVFGVKFFKLLVILEFFGGHSRKRYLVGDVAK